MHTLFSLFSVFFPRLFCYRPTSSGEMKFIHNPQVYDISSVVGKKSTLKRICGTAKFFLYRPRRERQSFNSSLTSCSTCLTTTSSPNTAIVRLTSSLGTHFDNSIMLMMTTLCELRVWMIFKLWRADGTWVSPYLKGVCEAGFRARVALARRAPVRTSAVYRRDAVFVSFVKLLNTAKRLVNVQTKTTMAM